MVGNVVDARREGARLIHWPSERGIWVMVGVPWLAGTLTAGGGTALALSGVFAAGLFCTVLAREPLSWTLWRRLHRYPPLPGWPAGALWGTAAVAMLSLWYLLAPAPAHLAGLAAIALGGAWEIAMRLRRARAWWPGLAGSGLTSAGAFLAAGAVAAPDPARWVAAGALAYAAACAMSAMGLHMCRVSRAADTRGPTALLWAWSAAGGALLVLAGSRAHAPAAAALLLGLGLLHAAMAQRQPRTRDFRRLGWREAVWLAAVGAGAIVLAGMGPG